MNQTNIPTFIGWTQNKTQRYKCILEALTEEPDIFFSITEIQEKVLTKYPQVFKVNTTMTKSRIKKTFHKSFHNYLKDLVDLGIVEYNISRNKWDNMDIMKFKIK